LEYVVLSLSFCLSVSVCQSALSNHLICLFVYVSRVYISGRERHGTTGVYGARQDHPRLNTLVRTNLPTTPLIGDGPIAPSGASLKRAHVASACSAASSLGPPRSTAH
jgi:hypothetical protein